MTHVRDCTPEDTDRILAIINAAAEAYRGVIPADRWHEPYMSATELQREIADGVRFMGCEEGGMLLGVMGIQPVREVDLIRHAYVLPEQQGRGLGGKLLRNFREGSRRPMLIGTWAAADWAIRFYQRHGFSLVSAERTPELLSAYWSIPERQIATSVVLADPPIED